MKIPIGNPQRLSLGAWVLGALLLLVHNGLSLTEVLDPPLPGYPNDIRGIRQQWGLLEQVPSLGPMEAQADFRPDEDELLARILRTEAPRPDAPRPELAPSPLTRQSGGDWLWLPRLTGILSTTDGTGAPRFFATIEGVLTVEGQKVWGFTVRKITEEGVVLARGKSSWFLKAPATGYSVVRPDRQAGAVSQERIETPLIEQPGAGSAPSEPRSLDETEKVSGNGEERSISTEGS